MTTTLMFSMFHAACNQKMHTRQQTVVCHITVGLLHVSALAWPSSGTSPTKEYV